MALRDAARGMSMGTGSAASIKRIQRELKEIQECPSRHWTASPANDDLFEWLFAIRGPPDTDFEGGIYTGRLVLPVNYPLAPPSIMLLTPNGRWEVNKKICLSNTSYHPDQWQPAWGIRTMMEALRSHFPVPGDGAIGAIDWPSDLRRKLAKESLDFISSPGASSQWAQRNRELLPELSPEELKEENPEPLPEQLAPAASPPSEQTETPAAVEQQVPTASVSQGGAAGSAAPQTPAPLSSSTETAQPSSTAAPKAKPKRRRDNSRPQRRNQNSILVQLIKPPTSGRGWLLMSLNILIVLVLVSFFIVLGDIITNPPKLLDPLPEPKEPKK
eukprot:TRINITY_DN34381_c0_g1_i1.p1 TRINITY_DN34381_c0_g1~~TRINITY_DN34381_c0_g1_i1.p1  ORF type:complete len:341 (-),score=64.38 TRINITY_DN34381_c0_g1_i1:110-1099(-)